MKRTFEEVEKLRQEFGVKPGATEEDWANLLHKHLLADDLYWEEHHNIYILLKDALRSEVKRMLATVKEG
jgi:hypothetical protein